GRGMRSAELLRQQKAEPPDAPLPPHESAAAFQSFGPYSPDDRPGHAALIDGDYKLHRIPAGGGQRGKQTPDAAGPARFTYKLFNLADDPQEKRDLAAQQPQ